MVYYACFVWGSVPLNGNDVEMASVEAVEDLLRNRHRTTNVWWRLAMPAAFCSIERMDAESLATGIKQ